MDLSGEGPPAGPGAFTAIGGFQATFPDGIEVETPTSDTFVPANLAIVKFFESVSGNTSTNFGVPSPGTMSGALGFFLQLSGGPTVQFTSRCIQEAQVIAQPGALNSGIEAEYEGTVSNMPNENQAGSSQAVASIAVTPVAGSPQSLIVNFGIEMGSTCFEAVFGPFSDSEIEIGGAANDVPNATAFAYSTSGTATAGRWSFPTAGGVSFPYCSSFFSNARTASVTHRPAGPPARPHTPVRDPGDAR